MRDFDWGPKAPEALLVGFANSEMADGGCAVQAVDFRLLACVAVPEPVTARKITWEVTRSNLNAGLSYLVGLDRKPDATLFGSAIGGPVTGFGSLEFVPDKDGDGVRDPCDECAKSDLSPTVVIDGVDTGVANDLLDDGCTLSDLIAEVLGTNASMSAVVQLLVDLKKDGLITGQEMGAMLKAINAP